MTNFEKIKAMSVEEMACFLTEFCNLHLGSEAKICAICPLCNEKQCLKNGNAADWLESENVSILTMHERYEIIKRVKKHDKPPRVEGDSYYTRSPWNHFGGIDDYGRWLWYYDDVIASRATDEELKLALEEIEK